MVEHQLDQQWHDIYSAAREGHHINIVGPAGSGKTTALSNIFLTIAKGFDGLPRSDRPVFLTPTRRQADIINNRRDFIHLQWSRPAITPMALSFSIIDAWHTQRKEPLPPPLLFTGADEDVLVNELLQEKTIVWPYDLSEEVTTAEGFRSELRELFAKCETYGLTSQDLYRHGKEAGIDMWCAASELLDEYRKRHQGDGKKDQRDEFSLFNTVNLQRRAADILDNWDKCAQAEGVEGEPPVPRLVVVDDAHDCSVVALGLLQALARRGAQVIVASSPDVCVNMYRGADPFIGDKFISGDLGGTRVASTFELQGSYRLHSAIVDKYSSVVSHIPQGEHDRMRAGLQVDNTTPSGDMRCVLTATAGAQTTYIANYLRRIYLAENPDVTWDDMMIICRTQTEVQQLRRGLATHNIPLVPLPRPINLASHRATKPILELIDIADEVRTMSCDSDVTVEHVKRFRDLAGRLYSIATSRLVGLDTLQVQQLKKLWLLMRDVSDPYEETFEGYVLTLVLRAERLGLIDNKYSWLRGGPLVTLRRLRSMIDAIEPSSHDIANQLWTIYDSFGCEARWLAQRQIPGAVGQAADEDFDAVIALQRTADVYQERYPNHSVSEFVTYQLQQEVPVDNLARTHVSRHGVEVVTTTECSIRQAKVVVITGLQDKVWPRLSAAQSFFSLSTFVDEVNRQTHTPADRDKLSAFNRLVDEYRALAVALSRSQRYLLACALDNDTDSPSRFFTLLREGCSVDDYCLQGEKTRYVRPLSLRGLVGQLRHMVTSGAYTPAQQDIAVDALAYLAQHGVRQADPTQWLPVGASDDPVVGLSSGEPLYGEREKVSISPSHIESMNDCPMRWMLSRYVGSGGESDAQRLGTLVHTIAEEAEKRGIDTPDDFLALAHQEGFIDNPIAGFFEKQEYTRQKELLMCLFDYMRKVKEEPHTLKVANKKTDFDAVDHVEVEKEVSYRIDDYAQIYGKIDRLESTNGTVRIVDIKTGKKAPSARDAEENLQIATYQYIVDSDTNDDVCGARLVYPGDQYSGGLPKVLQQGRLDEDGKKAVDSYIADAISITRSTNFCAKENPHCRHCDFSASCPAMGNSRRA